MNKKQRLNKLKTTIFNDFKQLIEEYFNPEPYKFEDLKEGMWIWDDVEKKCNKIIEILENNEISFYYITENESRYIVKFKENRFYPLTKAMQY